MIPKGVLLNLAGDRFGVCAPEELTLPYYKIKVMIQLLLTTTEVGSSLLFSLLNDLLIMFLIH